MFLLTQVKDSAGLGDLEFNKLSCWLLECVTSGMCQRICFFVWIQPLNDLKSLFGSCIFACILAYKQVMALVFH